MYNRDIRSDEGTYTRIPEEEPRPGRETHSTAEQPRPDPPPAHESAASPPHASGTSHRGESGMIQHLLDQLHLDRVDTGDLLLLALLFLLFREGADDEVLAALGLLLIL